MMRTKSLTLGLDDGAEILSVSSLNREVRRLIEEEIGTVWVEGEISNLARPSSGHIYFSLKDDSSQVRCAMFRQANRRLGFRPADGDGVLVHARAGLYEARGEYQLVVEHMEQAGEGALRRRFEELKAKLADEGLFDPAHKRPLPPLPARIGVVTSPTGAALQDILTSLRRRFPATRVLVYPASVQGAAAAGEIVTALGRAGERNECDLLILARGGGSLEDLWPFNEEVVARAVAAVPIPIIVGVGHETDFTIAEFVADLRAPTPSQAAELAVPEQAEYLSAVMRVEDGLVRAIRGRLRDEARKLSVIEQRLGRAHPGAALRACQQRLDEIEARLGRAMRQTLTGLASRLSLSERALRALNPLATLERGYAIVSRTADGHLVDSARTVTSGTAIDVRLARGSLSATVDATHEPK